MGWTRVTRDTLGRAVELRHFTGPDLPAPWASNTTSTGGTTTIYNGNCTAVTDQAGAARTSCVDGLGRLTSVTEDPGASPHLNYQTNYAYDTLDNLTLVCQGGTISNGVCSGGIARSFSYSSL